MLMWCSVRCLEREGGGDLSVGERTGPPRDGPADEEGRRTSDGRVDGDKEDEEDEGF